MDRPIFIVGANRSGTTLLRLVLNAHSHIAVPEEINYFYSFVGKISYEKWQNPELTRQEYASFVDRLLNERAEILPALDLDALRADILDVAQPNLRRPYRLLLEHWARQHGKSRWGEKTPSNLFYANIIITMFPDARFIHLIRDPRAGVCSMKRVSFYPTDSVLNALNRHKCMTEGRAWFEKHVPADQRMNLRYEDLVTDPEATVRRVCDFVQVAFEPSMMQFYETSEAYMKDEAAENFNAAATRPISSKMMHKWKTHLSPDEVAQIERICADEMIEFDYPLTGLRPSLRGEAERLIKTAYWSYQNWRNRRVRQYTVRHELFSGRTEGLKKIHEKVHEHLPTENGVSA